jgi:hypothetical protein
MFQLPWFGKKGREKSGRAPRIRAVATLHIREVGGFGWRTGTTENISQSGVLFRLDKLMEVGTPVEMQYSPPAQVTWATTSQVSCRGKIVRTQAAPSPASKPVCAAKIVTYEAWHKATDW